MALCSQSVHLLFHFLYLSPTITHLEGYKIYANATFTQNFQGHEQPTPQTPIKTIRFFPISIHAWDYAKANERHPGSSSSSQPWG